MKSAILSVLLIAAFGQGAVLVGNLDGSRQAAAFCATEESNNKVIAHENCAKYYQCWDGIPVAFNCGVGTLFNPENNYCDHPYNVDCGSRFIPEPEVIAPVDPVIPDGNNNDNPSLAPQICAAAADSSNILVAHENCNQFYTCLHGVPYAQTCQVGLLFDPSRDRCEWPDTVNCGNRIV